MKQFGLGLLCGAALTALTAAAYASETVQTILFPARYVIDGQNKALDPEYETLNYEGHVYAPVRWIAENTGHLVRYHHDTKTVSIDSTYLSKPLTIDQQFLSFAAKGHIKDIEFGLNASKSDVLKQWGEPHRTGSWQVPYDAWFDYYYFFANPNETVSAIRIGGESIPYTMDEIRKVLGTPQSEGVNDLEAGWYLYYKAGEREVYFNGNDARGTIRYMTLK